MPLYGTVRKMYQQAIKDWRAGDYGPIVVYFVILLVFCVAGVFGIVNILPHSPSVQATESNVAIGNSGILNQTLISKSLVPHINTTIISPSEKQSDGLYHTTYNLTIFGSDEAPPPQTFRWPSVFVKCLSTKFVGMQIAPPALINSIECLSKSIPPSPDTTTLFTP